MAEVIPTCPTCGNEKPTDAVVLAACRFEIFGHGADPKTLCCPEGTFAAATHAAYALKFAAERDALRAERDELWACLDKILSYVEREREAAVVNAVRCHPDWRDWYQRRQEALDKIAVLAKEPTRG